MFSRVESLVSSCNLQSQTNSMTLPNRPEVNVLHEVEKLKVILELPITNIVYDKSDYYGTLYVNQERIGTILYEVFPTGLMYDKSEEMKLDWSKVYMQYKDIIFDKIRSEEPLADYATISLYKTLLVKDQDKKVIKRAHCAFRKDNWDVVLLEPAS